MDNYNNHCNLVKTIKDIYKSFVDYIFTVLYIYTMWTMLTP